MNNVAIRGRELVHDTEQRAHAVVRGQRPWLVALSRAGYAAKGIVYLLVGALAAQAAFGRGGDTTDTEGALQHILQAPSGSLLLGAVAIGLAGYALWCLLAAAFDAERHGRDTKGIVARVGYAITGVIYAGLAATAIGLIVGTRSDAGGDKAAQDGTAWLLDKPFGPVLVAVVGLIVLGVAAHHIWLGINASFRKTVRIDQIDSEQREWVLRLGRLGYSAHGVALGLIAIFLMVASVQSRPDQARGLGGTLATLVQQPFGPALLALLGLGLAAYGLFMLVEARYRRIDIS